MAMIMCFDRSQHGAGVACYVRNNLSLTERNYFPHYIQTILIETVLPKTKSMTFGISYRPPLKQVF